MIPLRFFCPACGTELRSSLNGPWTCDCFALSFKSRMDGSSVWSYHSVRSGVLSVETAADGRVLYSRAFGPPGSFSRPVPSSELEAVILLEDVEAFMSS